VSTRPDSQGCLLRREIWLGLTSGYLRRAVLKDVNTCRQEPIIRNLLGDLPLASLVLLALCPTLCTLN